MTSIRSFTWCLTAVLVAVVAACGGGEAGTAPDDMSASEHDQTAGEEEQAAEQHEAEYDPNAETVLPTTARTSALNDVIFPTDVYNPTESHHAEAERLQSLAAQHRAAADDLAQFEEQECARFPAETRPSCPLIGQVTAVSNIDGGVKLELAPETNQEAVADHMRCHVAYARVHGREGMDRCPLYVEGAAVGIDGAAVTLTTDAGNTAVTALRRRARAHAAHH